MCVNQKRALCYPCVTLCTIVLWQYSTLNIQANFAPVLCNETIFNIPLVRVSYIIINYDYLFIYSNNGSLYVYTITGIAVV